MIVLCVAAASFLVSCKPPPAPKETYEYNVLLRHTSQRGASGKFLQKYIGTVKGLSGCRYHANTYKRQHGVNNQWQTVCCWQTNTSKCQEEHDPQPSKEE